MSTARFDELIHAPTRLAIVSLLDRCAMGEGAAGCLAPSRPAEADRGIT